MGERASFPRRLGALSVDWAIATFTVALIYPLQASSLAPSIARLVVFVIEVGLLTVSSQVSNTLSIGLLIFLPILFTLGMCLIDTCDGILMIRI
ncbi:MAG: hypothetical protein ACO3RD_04750, partial [Candidatus Nanopelagicaceae bacterium]